jgi:hypothetical protein
MGMGPMTGRAAGMCHGYSMPQNMNQIPGGRGMRRGQGARRGCGMGMGWRQGRALQNDAAMAYPIPSARQGEIVVLKNQAKFFGDSLENIQNRIRDLEAQKK